MTPLVTFVVALSVFVFSQYVLKLVIEPIVEIRRVMSKTSMWFLANQSDLSASEANQPYVAELRAFVSELWALSNSIPAYNVLAKILGWPNSVALLKLSGKLNLLSYNFHEYGTASSDERFRLATEIGDILRLPTSYHS